MFHYTYTIQKEDINAGNHVGNERALLFFQWARTNFLKQFGLSQINLGDNTGLIQLNSYVEYKAQIFLNDEIEIYIDNITIKASKILFDYTVKKSDKILISGYTTMTCYDYTLQKVKKIPDSFLELLENYKILSTNKSL